MAYLQGNRCWFFSEAKEKKKNVNISFVFQATIVEKLGLGHFMDVINVYTMTEYIQPTSDEKLIVTDTKFDHVPVRLYIPTKQSDVLKRAMIFIHGGGWCVGSASKHKYFIILMWVSNKN